MKKYLEFFEKSASDPAGLPNSTDCLSGIREEVESLSREDQMEEFMFLGLRKTEGISMNEFCKRLTEISLKCTGRRSGKWRSRGC